MNKKLTLAMGFLVVSATIPMTTVYGTDGTLPFAVQAPFQTTAPVLDGLIGAGEYGFMMPVSYANGMNPGEVSSLSSPSWNDDPTDANLSLNFYLGHDATNIYFGFEVTDNFNESANNADKPWRNDGVELVINGDGVNNDLGSSAEGFRYIVDAAGNSFDVGSAGLSNATSTTAAGYNVEIVVPLTSIDTIDGAGMANPTTGDTMKFTFAVNDNDIEDFDGQETFLLLWNFGVNQFPSTNEAVVAVDLELLAATLAGDYNNNGIVDAADYTVWRDGNSPDSSQAGYDLWKANFGNTSGSGSAAATGTAAVPEPSTALLLCLALAGLVASRCRRR